ASIVKINPDLTFEVISSIVFDYPENVKTLIFSLFKDNVNIKDLCSLNFIIGEYFAQAALTVCENAGININNIDIIGSHGQTIYHLPTTEKLNNYPLKSTLQIGELSIIAERTGVTTVADFRPADIAAGGEGAPLVCFADEIIFKDKTVSRAIQNIGGIGNVTVVSPNCDSFAFDTGPGNVLIDYFTNKFFNMSYDRNGDIAKSGKIDTEWLNWLLENPYLKLKPPKTTGRELFGENYAESILSNAPYKPEDVIATITAFTAKTIKNAYTDFVFPKTKIDEIVLGGGGAYNKTLISLLNKEFDYNIKIKTHEDFGISNKFKEAIAFALLAYTSYYGIPNNVPSCTGAIKKVVLGKIINR
ncbi:MAG: anhydro-N-acetylmuramic acid kinase, partial [Candidatus Gastranaerophilaceae bacterium]